MTGAIISSRSCNNMNAEAQINTNTMFPGIGIPIKNVTFMIEIPILLRPHHHIESPLGPLL